jgi:hypothetical protein
LADTGSNNDARVRELIGTLMRNPKDEAAERAFWQAFCNLPAWLLLTTADGAKKALEAGRPDIEVQMFQDGDRTFVPVFTSGERAKEAIQGQGFATASMPPEAALAYICGFRGQVEGFVVNPLPGQKSGFGHRLPDLCMFFRHARGFVPAGAVHCVLDYARTTKNPVAIGIIHEIIAGLDKVYVAIKDEQFVFVRDGEHLWISAFSDAAMAVRVCQQHPGVRMLEATPAELADRIEQAAAESEGKIKGAVLNHPENPIAIDLGLLRMAMEAHARKSG